MQKLHSEGVTQLRNGPTAVLKTFAEYASRTDHRARHTITLRPSGRKVKVWLSTLPWEVMEGLNGIPATAMKGTPPEFLAGMLFMHPKPEPLNYWISRVQFDIDVVFYSEDRGICGTGVIRRTPPTEVYCPLAMYVLELMQGALAGTPPGDSFDLDAGATEEIRLRELVRTDVVDPFMVMIRKWRADEAKPLNAYQNKVLNKLGIFITDN